MTYVYTRTYLNTYLYTYMHTHTHFIIRQQASSQFFLQVSFLHLSFSVGKEIATQPPLKKLWWWILFLLFCHQVHPVVGAYILNGTSEHESNVWEFSMCLPSEGSQGSLHNDGNAQTGPCWRQLCELVHSPGGLPATPDFAQLLLFQGLGQSAFCL